MYIVSLRSILKHNIYLNFRGGGGGGGSPLKEKRRVGVEGIWLTDQPAEPLFPCQL